MYNLSQYIRNLRIWTWVWAWAGRWQKQEKRQQAEIHSKMMHNSCFNNFLCLLWTSFRSWCWNIMYLQIKCKAAPLQIFQLKEVLSTLGRLCPQGILSPPKTSNFPHSPVKVRLWTTLKYDFVSALIRIRGAVT